MGKNNGADIMKKLSGYTNPKNLRENVRQIDDNNQIKRK